LTWLATFSLFLLVSCSTTEQPKVDPSYSDATEKTFDEIERTRVLDYYRQLRERGNPDIRRSRPTVVRPKAYKERRPRVKPTPRPKPVMSAEEREAVEREISQNLSYFCMLNRKDSRFSDEADCTAYTQNVLHECRQRTDENDGKRLVGCVKSNLKL
tara:strand:+ start:23952 stop:24422 length:471 start_codon:yes stop_codon:yes gene_type:complete